MINFLISRRLEIIATSNRNKKEKHSSKTQNSTPQNNIPSRKITLNDYLKRN
jgi:hypothetical protein